MYAINSFYFTKKKKSKLIVDISSTLTSDSALLKRSQKLPEIPKLFPRNFGNIRETAVPSGVLRLTVAVSLEELKRREEER